MDCHRCIFVKYDGCRYGRCSHPKHPEVRLLPPKMRKGSDRPYSKTVCNEFMLRKKCSNCKYWVRGQYFGDGMTPASKGRCSLGLVEEGFVCAKWKKGPTSWKRPRSPEPRHCTNVV